jgi:hypothetical protein
MRAGLSQCKRNAATNAPRSAGNQCRFAAEGLVAHGTLL